MAEGTSSSVPELEEDSSVNYESAEETLPQHDLDTPTSLKISSSKRVEQGENEPPKLASTNQKVEMVPKEGEKEDKKGELSPGKKKLHSWLNKQMKIAMTDGRVLVGVFLCTDRDANVILGSCTEYLNPKVCGFSDEPRILGLVMVPGRHIVSIHYDASGAQLSVPEEKD